VVISNFFVDPLLGRVSSAVYDWVPVDPADVRKMMLKERMDLVDSKHYLEYFWGWLGSVLCEACQGTRPAVESTAVWPALNTFGYP